MREIPLENFFLGFMETVLQEGELVTGVVIPVDPARRAVYSRFTPGSEDDYPTVGVAVALSLGADGTVERARLALGGVNSTATVVNEVGHLLVGTTLGTEVIAAAADVAAAAAHPSDDQRGTALYKRAMVEVWTRRTIQACLNLSLNPTD